jgi:Ca-activated chloride channel family protein
VQSAIQLIDGQSGGGGTELEAALRKVVALPRGEHVSRSVVVITDGYIAEEAGTFQLIADSLKHTNFFAFGIGSGVNRYLVEGIARAGQGEAFVALNPEEANANGERFRRYIQTPVLTNIRIKYNGFDAFDLEPKSQPDLFAERPIVVMGKWRGKKAGTIGVTGRTAAGEFKQSFDVSQATVRAENQALPRLWARTRIARLSDFNFEQNEAGTARQVTSLGLSYSLLTKYTSFIAVLEKVRNPEGVAQNVDQPLPLPKGVSDLAVGEEQYVSGAEPELWIMALMLFGTLGWVLLRKQHAAVGGLA